MNGSFNLSFKFFIVSENIETTFPFLKRMLSAISSAIVLAFLSSEKIAISISESGLDFSAATEPYTMTSPGIFLKMENL